MRPTTEVVQDLEQWRSKYEYIKLWVFPHTGQTLVYAGRAVHGSGVWAPSWGRTLRRWGNRVAQEAGSYLIEALTWYVWGTGYSID